MYFDTIYAISSGEIKSGVVVFRVSGPHAFKVIEIFSIRNLLLNQIEYRKTYLRNLYSNNLFNCIDNNKDVNDFKINNLDNIDGNIEITNHNKISNIINDSQNYSNEITNNNILNINDNFPHYKDDDKQSNNVIDKVMLLFFKGPNSFTGEDVVEIHAHGSIVVMKMISFELSKFFRHAKPGEFTKRAFLNNKMTLYEVDALQSLLAAETITQHQLSQNQINPIVQAQHQNWRNELLNIYAFIEAYIDFPEEELPIELINNIINLITEMKNKMQIAIEQNINLEKIKLGIRTTIIGKPNAGKSSLLNLLAQKQVAIVSKIPGTTRDSIETYLDIKGYQINIIDTAGIRSSTEDEIETIGINIAKTNFITSDIKIILISIDDIDIEFLQDIYNTLKEFYLDEAQLKLQKEQIIFVLNKIDLLNEAEKIKYIQNINNQDIQDFKNSKNANTFENINNIEKNINSEENNINFSKLTSKLDNLNNIKNLIKKIFELDDIYLNEDNFISISSTENININNLLDAIQIKCKSLHPKEPAIISNIRQREYFLHTIFYLNNALNNIHDIVFLSEDIRSAINALESIIGKIEVEEMLGKIFSEFCIGK
ncbi:MAG: tRNA modification GTPase [Rickettsiales bacterium]